MTTKTKGAEQNSVARQVLAYVFLPGIMPRVKALGGSGFGYLAFLIARVYQAVRILPANHIYANPANIGQFSIRQVIAEAADHVRLDRRNLDQIVIFFAILAGLAILVLQIFAFLLVVFSGDAWAQDANSDAAFAGLFKTRYPETDIAFMLLNEVFGIPDLFGKAAGAGDAASGAGPFPSPFHTGLHTLLQFYNLAILLVAVLVFLYYVVVVVAETAQSGTPFGKRFSHIYAPLRLVFALGLLVPINYGLNASQYITLVFARMGSGLASNGWILFNRELANPIGADSASMIMEPVPPEVDSLVEFMTVVHACRKAYEIWEQIEIDAYFVQGGTASTIGEESYQAAKEFYKNGDIEIVFGEQNDKHQDTGHVKPYCGILKIPFTVQNMPSLNLTDDAGPEKMQERFFRLSWFLWESPLVRALGERFAVARRSKDDDPCYKESVLMMPNDSGGSDFESTCKSTHKPQSAIKEYLSQSTYDLVRADFKILIANAREQVDLRIPQEVLERGWGGAGIWYNNIAKVNGAFAQAAMGLPIIKQYPELMEFVRKERRSQDTRSKQCEQFTPNLADNKPVPFSKEGQASMAKVMDETFRYWRCDETTRDEGFTGNIFWDTMHILFGTNGLFDIRKNSADKVHPLAQLTGLGRALVENAVRNLGFATMSAFGGGIAGAIGPHTGGTLQAISGFYVSIATIGLTAGFVLYYVLPFLPFIYFFFAVGGWVKGIFEAMVGAPLWALAHLRIDGDGFSGKSASNGYFLIFEIMIRPILTVFGLIGGMATFTAMAVILHEVFDLVVLNTAGVELVVTDSDPEAQEKIKEFSRHIVDEFFFTVMYTVIMYMMGTASFKMIDMVPNNMLRWLGAGVASFGDSRGDPTEDLVQYAAIGGATIGGQLAGGLTKAAGAGGQGIAAILEQGKQKQG